MDTFRDILSMGSLFVIPGLIVFFIVYGLWRRVGVYEEFVVGARDGFTTAVKIIPYLVAMLFAIAMFRASGAMDFLIEGVRPALAAIGVPAEILPMAITRPLTGSGSSGVLADMIRQYGPDAAVVKMAAVLYGSSETTFYVIAVYFGAVGVRRTRHALPAGLIADLAGVFLSVYVVKWLMGN